MLSLIPIVWKLNALLHRQEEHQQQKSIDCNCFCGFMEIEKIYLKMKSLQGRYQGISDAGWVFNSV